MYNVLENLFISKELYYSMLAPVCEKYNINQTEIAVLLFLANNPENNTATDIAKIRRLRKSSVSMAVRELQERGFITGVYLGGNHRSVHLNVCKNAYNIINEGQLAQNKFYKILTENFTEADQIAFKNYVVRVSENIREYNGQLVKNNQK